MSTGRPKVILVSPTNSMTVSMRVTTYAMPTHSFGMTIFAFANMSDGSMIQSADTMARSGILVAPAHRLIWRKASRASGGRRKTLADSGEWIRKTASRVTRGPNSTASR